MPIQSVRIQAGDLWEVLLLVPWSDEIRTIASTSEERGFNHLSQLLLLLFQKWERVFFFLIIIHNSALTFFYTSPSDRNSKISSEEKGFLIISVTTLALAFTRIISL
jgi:hypothetical protein